MTILSVCRDAAVKLNQTRPAGVFSATDGFPVELQQAANEAVEEILNCYDWQKLIRLGTLTGDSTTEAFNLPDGYDRMLKKAEVHSASWQTANFAPAKDLDDWLYLRDTNINGVPGTWVIFGGQMQIFPAMPTGETARFYYITNKIIANGTKAAFTADSDTFDLSERLLRLAIVWKWRANKRMEYAEDMQSFEIAKGEEILKDKGSKILRVGRQRIPPGVSPAYPGSLGS
jgi:hypothetical protein